MEAIMMNGLGHIMQQLSIARSETPKKSARYINPRYIVEPGIPCPSKLHVKKTVRKPLGFPFEHMKPGDSFLVSFEDLGGEEHAHRLGQIIGDYQKSTSRIGQFCYRVRYQDSDGEEGWRVWRVT